MSSWKVNTGQVLVIGTELTVDDNSIRFFSAVQSNKEITILESPGITIHENGFFSIPKDLKAQCQGYWGHSEVAGYDMTGKFYYSPDSPDSPGLPPVDDPDDFSATRVGPPVDLTSWRVTSRNSVIGNESMIEVWPDFVTFVSAVDGKTVLIPGVHAVADRGFTIARSENQPYAGQFTLDVAKMTGSISYDGGPAEHIEALRKVKDRGPEPP